MEIEEIKKNANCLKSEIIKMIREFEEKHDVYINLNVYHRFLTFDEKVRRNVQRIDGKEEQIAEVCLTLNL